MLWILLILAAILSAGVSTQSKRQFPGSEDQPRPFTYHLDICEEGQQWSEPTRPCETLFAIQYQCITGLDYDDTKSLEDNITPDCDENETCQSFAFQRTCFCQSQWHDSAQGCLDCYLKHGGGPLPWVPDQAAIYTFINTYCDPMVKPTAAFGDYMRRARSSTTSSSSTGSTSSTPFCDPIGFKFTEVSLYHTPSMTGIKAWATTLSTIRGWADDYIGTVSTRDSISPEDYVSATTAFAAPLYTASTLFSTTTDTPAHGTPSIEYSTIHTDATSSPTVGKSASTSRNALISIFGIVGSLSVVAIVVF